MYKLVVIVLSNLRVCTSDRQAKYAFGNAKLINATVGSVHCEQPK